MQRILQATVIGVLTACGTHTVTGQRDVLRVAGRLDIGLISERGHIQAGGLTRSDRAIEGRDASIDRLLFAARPVDGLRLSLHLGTEMNQGDTHRPSDIALSYVGIGHSWLAASERKGGNDAAALIAKRILAGITEWMVAYSRSVFRGLQYRAWTVSYLVPLGTPQLQLGADRNVDLRAGLASLGLIHRLSTRSSIHAELGRRAAGIWGAPSSYSSLALGLRRVFQLIAT